MALNDSKHMRVLYLSHGGGPMPLLGDRGHDEMVITLKRIAAMIAKPSAIIVVSAHWETITPTITHGSTPELIYDYYGFPDEAYDITYPAPGAPALADELHWSLQQHGIESILDDDRGFDHGLFVPLKIMYPDADIPCIQLSLVKGLEPAAHLHMGEALASLSHDNILVIGSGFSFHNMNAFFTPSRERTDKNDAFKRWLIKTCSDKALIESERSERLINWEHAPYARYCHPRAEHLLPLHVCYGATGRACDSVFEAEILGVSSAMFLWS
ncbi:class III extradiol ring-cleavage dioxygenase [Sulfurimonas diazotrophicus]|uniref:Class III extradiol ring-cleavage dioxygenase n=1 Tax=Sulfurimonas diazotrophicus TaxID=3131939 RepID=A0ABZ3HD27_9BACT